MESQLTEVNLNELSQMPSLKFNLYNSSGKEIFPAGKKIDPGFLLQLNYIKIFRQNSDSLTDNDEEEQITPGFTKSLLNELNTLTKNDKFFLAVLQENQDEGNIINFLVKNIEKKPIIIINSISELSKVLQNTEELDSVIFIGKLDKESVSYLYDLFNENHLPDYKKFFLFRENVKKLCPECREPYFLTPTELNEFSPDAEYPEVNFFREKGCNSCKNSGFYSKISIYGLIDISDSVNAGLTDLFAKMIEKMKFDGLKKVIRGLITINELDKLLNKMGDLQEIL